MTPATNAAPFRCDSEPFAVMHHHVSTTGAWVQWPHHVIDVPRHGPVARMARGLQVFRDQTHSARVCRNKPDFPAFAVNRQVFDAVPFPVTLHPQIAELSAPHGAEEENRQNCPIPFPFEGWRAWGSRSEAACSSEIAGVLPWLAPSFCRSFRMNTVQNSTLRDFIATPPRPYGLTESRANDVRLSTEAQSRRSVQTVCWAMVSSQPFCSHFARITSNRRACSSHVSSSLA